SAASALSVGVSGEISLARSLACSTASASRPPPSLLPAHSMPCQAMLAAAWMITMSPRYCITVWTVERSVDVLALGGVAATRPWNRNDALRVSWPVNVGEPPSLGRENWIRPEVALSRIDHCNTPWSNPTRSSLPVPTPDPVSVAVPFGVMTRVGPVTDRRALDSVVAYEPVQKPSVDWAAAS